MKWFTTSKLHPLSWYFPKSQSLFLFMRHRGRALTFLALSRLRLGYPRISSPVELLWCSRVVWLWSPLRTQEWCGWLNTILGSSLSRFWRLQGLRITSTLFRIRQFWVCALNKTFWWLTQLKMSSESSRTTWTLIILWKSAKANPTQLGQRIKSTGFGRWESLWARS